MEAFLRDLDILIARWEGKVEALKEIYHLVSVHHVDLAKLPERLLDTEQQVEKTVVPVATPLDGVADVIPSYGEDKAAKVKAQYPLNGQGLPVEDGYRGIKNVKVLEDRRRQVARVIMNEGPMSAFKLAQKLGVSDAGVRLWVRDCDWFDQGETGSEWHMTPTGLAAMRPTSED